MRIAMTSLALVSLCAACAVEPSDAVSRLAGAAPDVEAAPAISEGAELLETPEEPIAEAQQPLTPLALLCWLITSTATVAATASCSHHPEDPSCAWGATGGGIALSTLCWLF